MPCAPIWEPTPDPRRGIPILHIHGYLPRRGDIPEQSLILTETDFHALTDSVVNWTSGELASYLRNYTVLVIGLSLADPNLRRLLDATRKPGAPLSRFLLRKRYELPEKHQRMRMQRYVVEKAGLDPAELDKGGSLRAFGSFMERFFMGTEVRDLAHKLDKLVINDLDVGVLWISRYDDIGVLLDCVPTRKRLVVR